MSSDPTVAGCSERRSRTCAVCHLEAETFHLNYGVSSCFSCRAFFRRAIQKGRYLGRGRENNFVCSSAGEGCVVTGVDRTSCRKCRFEACMDAGMRPEAVLVGKEKAIRFRKKIRQRMEEESAAGGTGGGSAAKTKELLDAIKNAEDETKIPVLTFGVRTKPPARRKVARKRQQPDPRQASPPSPPPSPDRSTDSSSSSSPLPNFEDLPPLIRIDSLADGAEGRRRSKWRRFLLSHALPEPTQSRATATLASEVPVRKRLRTHLGHVERTWREALAELPPPSPRFREALRSLHGGVGSQRRMAGHLFAAHLASLCRLLRDHSSRQHDLIGDGADLGALLEENATMFVVYVLTAYLRADRRESQFERLLLLTSENDSEGFKNSSLHRITLSELDAALGLFPSREAADAFEEAASRIRHLGPEADGVASLLCLTAGSSYQDRVLDMASWVGSSEGGREELSALVAALRDAQEAFDRGAELTGWWRGL